MAIVYVVEQREQRALGGDYVPVGDVDIFETREDAQRFLESTGFEATNLLTEVSDGREDIEDGELWEDGTGWAIIYPKTPRIFNQCVAPTLASLHEGAIVYMQITGSRGAHYVIEKGGFEFSADVKRIEGQCSFCGNMGHDVGKAE